MNNKYIDLRSDTVTHPTKKMREAIYKAEVGDDVLQEDPTVNRLEEIAADMLGKEAAIFVPSGTFGNQLSLFTHCERGDEVILSENSHIVQHEAGASSVLSAVQLRTIMPVGDYLVWKEISKRIRKGEDIHYPNTGLISLENPSSLGIVCPLTEMEKIYKKARQLYKISVHLDGARIFNGAAALRVAPSQIAAYADSVMICLSKGLCAPVGSLLAGNKKFIEKARKKRKIMGGGMRQAGFLAAAGIIALEDMTQRLEEDNNKAKQLAEAFNKFDIFRVEVENVDINMFFVKLEDNFKHKDLSQFVNLLEEERILTYPPEENTLRFVTHYWVSQEEINYIIGKLPKLVKEFTD